MLWIGLTKLRDSNVERKTKGCRHVEDGEVSNSDVVAHLLDHTRILTRYPSSLKMFNYSKNDVK